MTMIIQSSMPHLDSNLQQRAGSICFASIDFCHGFWQIPLPKKSQEIMSIMSNVGIFPPTQTLQGGAESACYFHDATREKFAGRVRKLIQWIDEYVLHKVNENKLLDALYEFLMVCGECGFRVHARKSHFWIREGSFCGRIISEGSVKYDPQNLSAML